MLALSSSAFALHAAETETSQIRRSCCLPSEAPASRLTDKSLYQLDATWTNDNRQAVQLSSLKGRPQILVMFFANCKYACPLLVQQLKQIEAALPETTRTNVGFVLVSFDPKRDTPAALHDYRLQHELPADRWTLLHGDPGAVLDLAALLGVKFKADAQGQFVHSNVISLLNAEGEIVYQQTGLNSDNQEIVRRVEKLAVH